MSEKDPAKKPSQTKIDSSHSDKHEVIQHKTHRDPNHPGTKKHHHQNFEFCFFNIPHNRIAHEHTILKTDGDLETSSQDSYGQQNQVVINVQNLGVEHYVDIIKSSSGTD